MRFKRSSCPITNVLDLLGDKWTLLVIRDLVLGKRRYQEFLSSPEDMASNILAERLNRLQASGLILRRAYQRNPIRYEYLPGPVIREWWIRTLDRVIAPFVKDRGYDWEISIDETPCDLWSLQGELAPPFESAAEKRWVKENKASPYSIEEKLPVNLLLAPGVADR